MPFFGSFILTNAPKYWIISKILTATKVAVFKLFGSNLKIAEKEERIDFKCQILTAKISQSYMKAH
jgi:hypothetical protein